METAGQIIGGVNASPRVHSVIVLTSPDYHLPGPVGRVVPAARPRDTTGFAWSAG